MNETTEKSSQARYARTILKMRTFPVLQKDFLLCKVPSNFEAFSIKEKLWMKMIICARFARTFLGKRQCALEKRDIIIFSFYSVHVPLVKNGRPNDGFCHHRATINFILVSILMCHLRFIAYTQKKSRDFTANISSSTTLVEMSSKKSHFITLRAKRATFTF